MTNNQNNYGSRNEQSNRSNERSSENASRQATPQRDEEGKFVSDDDSNDSRQGRSNQRNDR